MSRALGRAEITNMVMVEDPDTGKVLVQNRLKSWCGISFPGGHVEPGESVYDSAVREVREETGLTVSDLKFCGVMHWFEKDTGDWYIEYFYKTCSFSGELVPETEEGPVYWASLDEIMKMPLSPNFKEYLPLFLEDRYTEGYCAWSGDMNAEKSVIYR